jgi:hypothetical protein
VVVVVATWLRRGDVVAVGGCDVVVMTWWLLVVTTWWLQFRADGDAGMVAIIVIGDGSAVVA